MLEQTLENPPAALAVSTEGGAAILHDASVKDGDLVGHDKITNNFYLQTQTERAAFLQSSDAIRLGLKSLGVLIEQIPELAETVREARGLLVYTRDQVRRINACKETHDRLQRLERSYRLLEPKLYDFGSLIEVERVEWRGVRQVCLTVQEDIDAVCRHAGSAYFAKDAAPWLETLRHAMNNLHNGFEEHELRLLDAGAQDIHDVLGLRISEMNNRLIDAVDDDSISHLLEAMRAVLAQITPDQTQLVETAAAHQSFAAGLDSLESYANTVLSLRTLHNLWQGLDDQLRREHAQLGRGTQRVMDRWERNIRTSFVSLCDAETNPITQTRLLGCSHQLVQALGQADLVEADAALYDLRSAVSNRFAEVDFDLRQVCGKLRDAGEPLEAVLSKLQ